MDWLHYLTHLLLDKNLQRFHLLLYRLDQLALDLSANRLHRLGQLVPPARTQCLAHLQC